MNRHDAGDGGGYAAAAVVRPRTTVSSVLVVKLELGKQSEISSEMQVEMGHESSQQVPMTSLGSSPNIQFSNHSYSVRYSSPSDRYRCGELSNGRYLSGSKKSTRSTGFARKLQSCSAGNGFSGGRAESETVPGARGSGVCAEPRDGIATTTAISAVVAGFERHARRLVRPARALPESTRPTLRGFCFRKHPWLVQCACDEQEPPTHGDILQEVDELHSEQWRARCQPERMGDESGRH